MKLKPMILSGLLMMGCASTQVPYTAQGVISDVDYNAQSQVYTATLYGSDTLKVRADLSGESKTTINNFWRIECHNLLLSDSVEVEGKLEGKVLDIERMTNLGIGKSTVNLNR